MRQQPTSYSAALRRFCDALLESDPQVLPYTNNYVGGHTAALEHTYPAIREYTGSECFAALARVYLRHHPPRHWDLNLYGDGFAQLLGAQVLSPRGDEFDWSMLAALASVEYAVTRAYYADDASEEACEPEWIPGIPNALPEVAGILTPHYPFADVNPRLTLACPVAVWRPDLRVQVTNSVPERTRTR